MHLEALFSIPCRSAHAFFLREDRENAVADGDILLAHVSQCLADIAEVRFQPFLLKPEAGFHVVFLEVGIVEFGFPYFLPRFDFLYFADVSIEHESDAGSLLEGSQARLFLRFVGALPCAFLLAGFELLFLGNKERAAYFAFEREVLFVGLRCFNLAVALSVG